MAIIKGNKQIGGRPPSSDGAGSASASKDAALAPGTNIADTTKPAAEPAAEPALVWTYESVEAGLVPERRLNPIPAERLSNDRRRGYRRVEEKDLISRAVEEAAAIRERAQQEGLEEGLRQSEALIAQLRQTIDQMLNAREDALISAAEDIGAIAVEVAERIIKTEVTCDASLVMALVKDTIQKMGREAKTILVKVHPEDVTLVKQALRDNPIPNLRAELIIMEDSTVDQGSCIVETNSGLVDASFSTQLGILRQLFGTVEQAVKNENVS